MIEEDETLDEFIERLNRKYYAQESKQKSIKDGVLDIYRIRSNHKNIQEIGDKLNQFWPKDIQAAMENEIKEFQKVNTEINERMREDYTYEEYKKIMATVEGSNE
jgi:hypothetical protein